LFSVAEFNLYQRSNYILSLNNSYNNIAAVFSENHLRNIKRAIKSKLTIKKNIAVKEVIILAKKQSKKIAPMPDAHYKNFQKLCNQLYSLNQAITYGVFNAEKKLVASCVFFYSHNRAYYILAGNDPDGKTSGASHFLINSFIQDHADKNMLLDFEGSEIKNVAAFYKKFGAKEEKYPAIKLNKLPAVLKLFKK
jgi:lipid II:glycine glycyltransferase (peptidoglycan interpeptide bridge formation enzyme)